ncbi:dimethylamine:proton symporter, ABT family [Methanosarcina thermophila]|jgi:amino acid transporter|uniref:Dimethylamine permease n=3 Tax=Methanosarcina thermophila TaxID=2210 RepID=A0A1I7AFJ0_METTE|nr:APC family permease [Methanosarcina thermophila]ALK06144.1 MAG: amino acid permease [Methanosarcina sp. 795]AKB12246.1 Dimethylamine permease [Methanosarcina thermophila TM-1]AKB14551.1 Dimethylamine permease [Methanosarcina thermophila CHTI-55]NLU58135.1 APC family permease [Methanosarcina thermophila]SFT73722.1 dimethylamine:proton symporter, ABT family [Methanosarcina thermophila]
MNDENGEAGGLQRTIDWRQGLAIALGVPVLILPSIGYFANYVWAFAIIIWALSVFQGFMQNFAYGELATMFPKASGLPGYAQSVFTSRNANTRYDRSKLLGGFSAWSYWFAWNPVLAIFSILIGSYLKGLIPAFADVPDLAMYLTSGAIVFLFLILVNYRGLSGGATLGYILAVLSLAPLIVISLAPFVTGHIEISNITGAWLPTDWSWDIQHILILLGLMAMAQWSACAWETAAIYGPEYKQPKSDVPKALFICGSICLVTFILVQAACTGTLGIEGILAEPFSPMLPLAQITLGPIGGALAILMLIAAMILIIQTAFLGASRAMYSMAEEGNLPSFFGKMNTHGTPVNAMIVIALLNMGFIFLGTPAAILAASAIGYVCANGISLLAYVKAKIDPRFSKLERPFKAPGGWRYVALFFGLFNLPLCLIGLVYLNSLEVGWASTIVGFVVLTLYLPLWFYSQNENQTALEIDTSPQGESMV